MDIHLSLELLGSHLLPTGTFPLWETLFLLVLATITVFRKELSSNRDYRARGKGSSPLFSVVSAYFRVLTLASVTLQRNARAFSGSFLACICSLLGSQYILVHRQHLTLSLIQTLDSCGFFYTHTTHDANKDKEQSTNRAAQALTDSMLKTRSRSVEVRQGLGQRLNADAVIQVTDFLLNEEVLVLARYDQVLDCKLFLTMKV
jgi:hypothetical protein